MHSSSSTSTSTATSKLLTNADLMSRYNVGRQIINSHSGLREDETNNLKRMSTTSQSSTSTFGGHRQEPLQPSNLPDARRPSVPTIHLRASENSPLPTSPPSISVNGLPESTSSPRVHPNATLHSPPGDLYRNLSTFQFGAPSSISSPSSSLSYSADSEADRMEEISPLTAVNQADRTPRPSVSTQARGRGHSGIENELNSNHSHPTQHAAELSTDSGRSPPRNVNPDNPGSSSSTARSARTRHLQKNRTGSDPSSDIDAKVSNAFTSRGHGSMEDPVSDKASMHTFGQSTSMAETSAASISSRSSSLYRYRQEQEGSGAVFSSGEESEVVFDSDSDEEDIVHSSGDVSGGVSTQLSPVTFARRGLDVIDGEDEDELEYVDVEWEMAPNVHYGERRSSLPMAIPGASSSVDRPIADLYAIGREREDSVATLRKLSRSVDDELRSFHGSGATAGVGSGQDPQSEPRTRGDWRSLAEAHAQQVTKDKGKQKQSNDDGAITLDPALEGYNTSFILNDATLLSSRRASDAPSYVQRPPHSQALSPRHNTMFPFSWNNDRRPSTATVGTSASVGDDTFDRHVRNWDKTYIQRKAGWSFTREKADGPGFGASTASSLRRRASDASGTPRGSISGSMITTAIIADTARSRARAREAERLARTVIVGGQEIWRNEVVGRFKVDRTVVQSNDSSRAPQQRLSVRHIFDPYNRGNLLGGPGLMVHKHSRAVAFSLYRAYHMYISYRSSDSTRQDGARTGNGKKAAANILLAPRNVQEEYTSTRTTSKLDTHGLLEGGNSHRRAPSSGRREILNQKERAKREKELEKERLKEAEKQKKLQKAEEKRKAREAKKAKKGTDSQTSSNDSMSTSLSTMSGDFPPPVPPKDSEPFVPHVEHTYPPQAPNIHRQISSRKLHHSAASVEASPPASTSLDHQTSISDHSTVIPPTIVGRRDSDLDVADLADLDDYPPTRTPHSEAFDTLDSNVIEYVRNNRSEHQRLSEPANRSVFSQVKQYLRPSKSRASGSFIQPGPTSASLEGNYQPPWIVMAPRDQVEEQERVIYNLSNSFKDVGLLPTGKPTGRRTPKERSRRRPGGIVDIFEQVPEDSLYMVLPLWPGETDKVSTRADDITDPPLEERQYVLVYYVPFAQKKNEKMRKLITTGKKGKRPMTPPSDSDNSTKSPNQRGELSSFRIGARMVGYKEMRGSGIRLPGDGLSITGPIADALKLLPDPSKHHGHHDDVVIAQCLSRERGIEFLPEGLTKLGLCIPVDPLPTFGDAEAEEPEPSLSPIGRAVVEMAWLGGMALTSFTPVI